MQVYIRSENEIKWQPLSIPPGELRCSKTLLNGQCFTWFKVKDDVYAGVLDGRAVLLKETAEDTLFFGAERARLHRYFQLNLGSLEKLLPKWGLPQCTGIRLVEVEFVECLFSFICSSQNNIGRIHKLVNALRVEYGSHVATVFGTPLYTFPTLAQLSRATTDELRELGFGYRDQYIVRTIAKLPEFPVVFTLKQMSESKALETLQILDGVGPKVAACVALMSLGFHQCVPLDVHMKRYLETQRMSVEDFYRRYGSEGLAGWAQLLIFSQLVSAPRPRSKKRKA